MVVVHKRTHKGTVVHKPPRILNHARPKRRKRKIGNTISSSLNRHIILGVRRTKITREQLVAVKPRPVLSIRHPPQRHSPGNANCPRNPAHFISNIVPKCNQITPATMHVAVHPATRPKTNHCFRAGKKSYTKHPVLGNERPLFILVIATNAKANPREGTRAHDHPPAHELARQQPSAPSHRTARAQLPQAQARHGSCKQHRQEPKASRQTPASQKGGQGGTQAPHEDQAETRRPSPLPHRQPPQACTQQRHHPHRNSKAGTAKVQAGTPKGRRPRQRSQTNRSHHRQKDHKERTRTQVPQRWEAQQRPQAEAPEEEEKKEGVVPASS